MVTYRETSESGKSGLLETRIKDGAEKEWITNTGDQPVNDQLVHLPCLLHISLHWFWFQDCETLEDRYNLFSVSVSII